MEPWSPLCGEDKNARLLLLLLQARSDSTSKCAKSGGAATLLPATNMNSVCSKFVDYM